MTGAGLVLAAGLSALPAAGALIDCRFDRACIDRRPCYDAQAWAKVTVLDDALAVLETDADGRRPALIRREGVWTTVITAPDPDHANRVAVLDWAADGRATLVVSSPGTAIEMLSRTGTCDVKDPQP
ncbi:MAG: hypothetical protein KDA50_03385 [Rhodobacteraceae bacterium]|nr:hypothetical protein [Paracoccaceae bacterium]